MAGVWLVLTMVLLTPRALPAQAPSAPLIPSTPRVEVVRIPGSVPEPRQAVVLLPADYAGSARRYPVLYLLHGLWGSHRDWIGRTNLVEYTADLPLIVVLPDAGDSWYTNSATDEKQRFEDYIGRDVVAYVDAHYRTLPYPQARYVAGLSMGGYGAIKLGIRNPRTFSLAASFSGAFGYLEREGVESIEAAFGPRGSEARVANDVATLLRAVEPGAIAALPYIYLDCGTSDALLADNRRLGALLHERGARYEYHEVAGRHEWEYWDRRLPHVLALIAARIDSLVASRTPATRH